MKPIDQQGPILELSAGEKLFLHAYKLIPIAACLIGSTLLWWRCVVHAPPKKSELRLIDGVVSEIKLVGRSSKYDSAEHPIVHLAGRGEAFVYLDWFPESEKVGQALKAGDNVRLLSDVPEGNHWIWQLEKDGRTVVAYERVLAAVRHNNRFDPLIALGLGLTGVWGLVRYFRKERGEKDDETEEAVREESQRL